VWQPRSAIWIDIILSNPISPSWRAARAVGSAVGANPIAFIIPCHRVIRETGVLGNYRWDAIRKCAMIGWEISARSPLRTGEPYRIQADAA